MTPTEYFFVGVVPVKFEYTVDGGLRVLQMNWHTGVFELDRERYLRIMYSRGGVDTVTEDEFIQRVEATRAKQLSGEGPVFALYKLMNGIEDVARSEQRDLRPDEDALLAELRRRSYALFQSEHPDEA